MKARIGLIGVAVVATMILTTLFQPLSFLRAFARDNEPCRTFRETGKTVCAPFLNYWQQHGGPPIFGYPVSQPFQERSALNGKPYIVQYFERAVFEQHPENRPPDDVLLSQLGTYRFHSQYPGKDPSEPYTDNLPRYPDAQLIQIRHGNRPSEFTTTMTYVTRATPEEIFAFYRDVLGKDGWIVGQQQYPDSLGFGYPRSAPLSLAYGIDILTELMSPSQTKVTLQYLVDGSG